MKKVKLNPTKSSSRTLVTKEMEKPDMISNWMQTLSSHFENKKTSYYQLLSAFLRTTRHKIINISYLAHFKALHILSHLSSINYIYKNARKSTPVSRVNSSSPVLWFTLFCSWDWERDIGPLTKLFLFKSNN